MSWREFWNGTHSIYVNERHRALHYEGIARDIVSLIPSPDAQVMDYGCGDAEAAESVARACNTLYLYDAAPNVQERLRLHFGRNDKIVVLSTDALALVADSSLDLIVVNSILQYLTLQEFEALLPFWRMKLKDDGRLIVADVIPRNASAIDDVRALDRLCLAGRISEGGPHRPRRDILLELSQAA